jgi:dihydrofolate reductase
MMKASVYVASSVDGFIARPDGSLDWLGSAPAAKAFGQALDTKPGIN